MPIASLSLILDGTSERSGPDFDPNTVIRLDKVTMIGMPEGTRAGRASVMFRFDLPDGQIVFAETTLRLLLTAAQALASRYPGAAESVTVQ
jgi:hypothetical protein